MVNLVPITDKEFDAFLDKSVKNYAIEKVKSGNWPEEGSLERSMAEFKRLLPNGKDSKDNFIYKIVESATGEPVGTIWVALTQRGELPGAFIYDIEVNEKHRGKGYGKEAMKELEKVVTSLGRDRISLHVFGHNKVAISLYQSLGYQVTNINMSKIIK
ncbi:MAG: GNAT family N-acetyltransferase [Candidatus Thermoplasmatota archaeon]|nr:GNAT family N-acetyltransferase [Candidatus Thermoplasmatota archaeon]